MRLAVGATCWEFRGGCFGLNVLPQKFMSVMTVLEKVWRSQGILCFVYLDDILILGQNPNQVEKHLSTVVDTLLKAGFKINEKKSLLAPTQNLQHLGFQLDLKNGFLNIGLEKLKMIQREFGKVRVAETLTCRKMASILGCVRSCLVALPCLRAFTDQLSRFVNLQTQFGWDHVITIPQALKEQLQELKEILQNWKGRKFCQAVTKTLHSDSSDFAWAGINPATGEAVQEFWREKSVWHINLKELLAAISTVQALVKPGESIKLCVDNTTAFYYLKKQGGRLPHLNALLRPFLQHCLRKGITVQPTWVPSKSMEADSLSRWQYDQGDYTLNRNLFLFLKKKFAPFLTPRVDMFSSPGNCQLDNFVARWPHFQALATDALTCDLSPFRDVYANPPWNLLDKWLLRLREAKHVRCMLICPYWASTRWWPLLIKLHTPHTPVFLIQPFNGMFTNCQNQCMRAPKWPLVCVMLSGANWRSNKSQLKLQKIFWE